MSTFEVPKCIQQPPAYVMYRRGTSGRRRAKEVDTQDHLSFAYYLRLG